MPGRSVRVSANSVDKPAGHRAGIGLEPMWPALARGVIFLIALATPIVVTLLSR
ncbi:MAG TPA: hypothetical protein VKY22_30460 [Bradyrhizobium sp.]|nr:hypothetical protein [Bradyrhizobium sp.]